MLLICKPRDALLQYYQLKQVDQEQKKLHYNLYQDPWILHLFFLLRDISTCHIIHLLFSVPSACEKNVQKVCANSTEENLQPFKEKMEGFISAGELNFYKIFICGKTIYAETCIHTAYV